MCMHRASGSYWRLVVVACVVLSFMWVHTLIARAQIPSDVGRTAEACAPEIINAFLLREFDVTAAKALKAHQASEDSDLGRQIAAARERTRHVIEQFEADDVTPIKMRKALALSPYITPHLDVYDAEVARLQRSGGMSPAAIAERAWLRARDAADGGRIVTEPDRTSADGAKILVFAADYPLSDSERSMLPPSQRANSSFGLLSFMALYGVPGIRFPYYGGFRSSELPRCMAAPGPRDVGGFLAFDAAPYANKPMLDEFYYGHTERLDVDKVVLYFQPFIETLDQIKGCDKTISQADYAALVAKFPLSYGKRTLGSLNDRSSGNLDDAFGRGVREAQRTMQPSVEGITDAHIFFNTHGCSSPEASKVFGNLETWIEKEVVGVR